MKLTTLCLCLVMGCAGTTPSAQDMLEEFARGVTLLNASYHAECDGREETATCISLREHYGRILDWLEKQNEKLPQ